MNKCPYCRANPCGCGASVYYPELFKEPDGINCYGQPIKDWNEATRKYAADDEYLGDSGSSDVTILGVASGGKYSTERPKPPPYFEIIK